MIINENNEEIINPDLNNGYLINTTVAKPGAYDTIDNITKFALNDNDYIKVQKYIHVNSEEKAKQQQIQEEKNKQEEFLNTGQQQLTEIMQAVAELGVLVTGGK